MNKTIAINLKQEFDSASTASDRARIITSARMRGIPLSFPVFQLAAVAEEATGAILHPADVLSSARHQADITIGLEQGGWQRRLVNPSMHLASFALAFLKAQRNDDMNRRAMTTVDGRPEITMTGFLGNEDVIGRTFKPVNVVEDDLLRLPAEFIGMVKQNAAFRDRLFGAWIPGSLSYLTQLIGGGDPSSMEDSGIGFLGLNFIRSESGTDDVTKRWMDLLAPIVQSQIQQLHTAGYDFLVMLQPSLQVMSPNGHIGLKKYIVAADNLAIAYAQSLGMPVVYHVCGQVKHFLDREVLAAVNANAFSLDSMVDLKRAHEQTGRPILGNLDTGIMKNGTQQQILEDAFRLRIAYEELGENWLPTTGCETRGQKVPIGNLVTFELGFAPKMNYRR